MSFLDDEQLQASGVVANNAMNRERDLSGTNSYEKDLGFDIAAWLESRLETTGRVSWLDLCCGSGKALIQARQRFGSTLHIVGVDLVEFFAPVPPGVESPEFVVASLSEWTPSQTFDLVTCVHGVHYLGDKLDLLARACSWLKERGRLVANFDLAQVHLECGSAARQVAKAFREAGIDYSGRKKLVSREGPAEVDFPWTYLGADDRMGPNYTGQPAVASHYR